MRQGDTFLILAEEPKKHLWVVLSDPEIDDSQVVFVSLTTLRERSDTSCVIEPGEHPFVSVRTCVDYRRGRSEPLSRLVNLQRQRGLQMKEPLSQELLRRILDGARDSDFTILGHLRILEQQGLIDP